MEALSNERDGLSPRVRGNPARRPVVHQQAGSIPACAGEPKSGLTTGAWTSVYPRVCGGTPSIIAGKSRRSGLSPRVRGNRMQSVQQPVCIGSIPACAGEPPHIVTRGDSIGVYPRVCGGTNAPRTAMTIAQGLSPRVRGNPQINVRRVYAQRSIPACAGEPLWLRRRMLSRRVYPRVCGGTSTDAVHTMRQPGLSPRVRGNPNTTRPVMYQVRSIPACAGEPRSAGPPGGRSRVYPRVCGGTPPAMATSRRCIGLSPRVRGNLRNLTRRLRIVGSIPACAGEPDPLPLAVPCSRVYPRVCGGTIAENGTLPNDRGLSPRVRGNRRQSVQRNDTKRSIPACAGEPTLHRHGGDISGVYPRVCGGTSDVVAPTTWGRGLSPRVRGNPIAW